ncbi:MAG: lipopolysaccharide transport periplasmic protein LptA [Stenotrophobium sp.]
MPKPVVSATPPSAPPAATPAPAPAAAPATTPAATVTPIATPAATAIATPAAAPAVAPASSREALRPEGPVTVTADHAEWQQDGVMIYSGHVLLVSSSLTLKGDRIELQQQPDGQYTAKVDGKPAQMDHAASTDSKGQSVPPVNAKASSLRYDSRSSVVDLIGNSVLTRGKDQITGSSIRYNVAERRIEAAGNSSGGQVRIVIQPPPPKTTSADKKP